MRDHVTMKTFDWVVLLVAFVITTNRCGKSIKNQDWGESVAEFLLALGVVLIFVRNAPSF